MPQNEQALLTPLNIKSMPGYGMFAGLTNTKYLPVAWQTTETTVGQTQPKVKLFVRFRMPRIFAKKLNTEERKAYIERRKF